MMYVVRSLYNSFPPTEKAKMFMVINEKTHEVECYVEKIEDAEAKALELNSKVRN